jgi:hypothetical protein
MNRSPPARQTPRKQLTDWNNKVQALTTHRPFGGDFAPGGEEFHGAVRSDVHVTVPASSHNVIIPVLSHFSSPPPLRIRLFSWRKRIRSDVPPTWIWCRTAPRKRTAPEEPEFRYSHRSSPSENARRSTRPTRLTACKCTQHCRVGCRFRRQVPRQQCRRGSQRELARKSSRSKHAYVAELEQSASARTTSPDMRLTSSCIAGSWAELCKRTVGPMKHPPRDAAGPSDSQGRPSRRTCTPEASASLK